MLLTIGGPIAESPSRFMTISNKINDKKNYKTYTKKLSEMSKLNVTYNKFSPELEIARLYKRDAGRSRLDSETMIKLSPSFAIPKT